MRRIAVLVLAGCLSTHAMASEPVTSELTAAQIVEKNVAARGGLEAWRKIQSMIWIGHIESAQALAPKLEFVLEMKNPNKTRFEVKAQYRTFARIYDGTHGWKLRPSSSGIPELLPYTPGELSFAHEGQGIDGPLMDYQAKGIAVALDGVDEIGGRKAYRLNLKLPSGGIHRMWIDAQTFLDVKYDRGSRDASGRFATMSVFYSNYKVIEGLQIPLTIESGMGTAKATDKMVVDRILLNPPLEDRIFVKPSVPGTSNAAKLNIGPAHDVRQSAPAVLSRHPGFSGLSTPSVSGAVGAR